MWQWAFVWNYVAKSNKQQQRKSRFHCWFDVRMRVCQCWEYTFRFAISRIRLTQLFVTGGVPIQANEEPFGGNATFSLVLAVPIVMGIFGNPFWRNKTIQILIMHHISRDTPRMTSFPIVAWPKARRDAIEQEHHLLRKPNKRFVNRNTFLVWTSLKAECWPTWHTKPFYERATQTTCIS